MTNQQRDAILQQRRERWLQNHTNSTQAIPSQSCNNAQLRNSSVDSPEITQKMKEFHEKTF